LYASFLVPVAASSSSSSNKNKANAGKRSKHVAAIENDPTPTVQEVMPVSSLTAAATNEGSLPSAQISNQVPIIEDEATPTNQGSVTARMTLSEEINRTKPTSSSSKGGEVDKVVTSLPSAKKSNQMPNTEHDATPATEGRNAARMISNSTAAATNRGDKPRSWSAQEGGQSRRGSAQPAFSRRKRRASVNKSHSSATSSCAGKF
jgi:hypothetical protein